MKVRGNVLIWDREFDFKTKNHGDISARVALTRYIHEVPALYLVDEEAEPLICLTVNLFPMKPRLYNVFLRTWGDTEGLINQLITHEIVGQPTDYVYFNHEPLVQEHGLYTTLQRMYETLMKPNNTT